MPMRVFDTQLGAQLMEGICELQHYLVPLVRQRGPSLVLVIIVSHRVIFLLDHIHKKYQVVSAPNILDYSMEFFSE